MTPRGGAGRNRGISRARDNKRRDEMSPNKFREKDRERRFRELQSKFFPPQRECREDGTVQSDEEWVASMSAVQLAGQKELADRYNTWVEFLEFLLHLHEEDRGTTKRPEAAWMDAMAGRVAAINNLVVSTLNGRETEVAEEAARLGAELDKLNLEAGIVLPSSGLEGIGAAEVRLIGKPGHA